MKKMSLKTNLPMIFLSTLLDRMLIKLAGMSLFLKVEEKLRSCWLFSEAKCELQGRRNASSAEETPG